MSSPLVIALVVICATMILPIVGVWLTYRSLSATPDAS